MSTDTRSYADRVSRIDELRTAVHSDPRGVAFAAAGLLPAARAAGDAAAVSRILAVLGRARRSLGEIALAESDLDEAIALALAAGEDDLAADAHVGLAGVLSFAGRSVEAFAHLDQAQRLGGDLTRAHASLQRAIIEQRIGRMREALARYDAALPTLRRLNRCVDIALVLMNRGVIRLQSGQCARAVADLTESRDLFDRESQAFGVAQAEHNLGWAHTRWGDLPQALRYLDSAAERFHALGHAALEVEVDRVEVLLAAGLYAEAADLAAETATRLSLAGNHSQAAETWLLLGGRTRRAGSPALRRAGRHGVGAGRRAGDVAVG
jgi:tetratricopeptide (TPR) repeat protein